MNPFHQFNPSDRLFQPSNSCFYQRLPRDGINSLLRTLFLSPFPMSFLDRLDALGCYVPKDGQSPSPIAHLPSRSIPATLEEIRRYTHITGCPDFSRCAECGVFFLPSGGLLVNPAVLAKIAGVSKSALNCGLLKAGFRKGASLEAAMQELPCPAALRAPRQWIAMAAPEKPQPSEVDWEIGDRIELPLMPVKVSKEPITPEEMALAEFFGDDPFCLVPDFLLEDARQFVCNKNR
jgi:hypothetical protein